MKKSKTDPIYIVTAGLAVSNSLLALDGCLLMATFLYMCHISHLDVPAMVCSAIYTCWLLATQISTTLIMIISIIRVISVKNISKMSATRWTFTRRRVIALVVVVGIVSVAFSVLTTTVDYFTTTFRLPFCHFRMSILALKITTHFYLVAYIINYVICIALYGASICILIKVHLQRRQVNPCNVATTSTLDQSLPVISTLENNVNMNSSDSVSVRLAVSRVEKYKTHDTQLELEACGVKTQKQNEESSQQTAAQEITANVDSTNTVVSGNDRTATIAYPQFARRKSREQTATLILGLIIAMHSVCVVPWIVHLFLLTYNTKSGTQALLAMLFGIVNVIVDPVIYVMSLQSARRKARACLKC